MPSFLETLLALNGGNLPPLPSPAPSMPLLPAPVAPISTGPAYGASPDLMSSNIAPTAPLPPLDMNFVNQYAGAPPIPPVIQQPGLLDKLSTALLGVSAGLQGRGGEFAQSVKAQQEAPQREYQRQVENYQQNRRAGLELATRKQERQ